MDDMATANRKTVGGQRASIKKEKTDHTTVKVEASEPDGAAKKHPVPYVIENGVKRKPKGSERLAGGLCEILRVKLPTVRKGLKMKRTLTQFDRKITQLCDLVILEKEAYVLEILADADPGYGEDLDDVDFYAALVVLEVLGCNYSNDKTSKSFTGIDELHTAVNSVLVGMRFHGDRIDEMIAFEKNKGEGRKKKVEAVERDLEHYYGTRSLTRQIYVPASGKKPTIVDLEGKSLGKYLLVAGKPHSSENRANAANVKEQGDGSFEVQVKDEVTGKREDNLGSGTGNANSTSAAAEAPAAKQGKIKLLPPRPPPSGPLHAE